MGRMRVLLDDPLKPEHTTGRISIRFQGRGVGNGVYRVINATVSQRNGTSLDIIPESKVTPLTVEGQASFDVPEYGVVTDEIETRYFFCN